MSLLRFPGFLLAISALLSPPDMVGQGVAAPARAESSWVGQRIVMRKGMGEVHHSADGSRVSSAVGINLVSPVARVDGSRLWIVSTSGSDSGWVDSTSVIRLSQAVPYFSTMIQGAPDDWGAYPRRAEAEHALNQRDAATQDYSAAIRLHPLEAFLYLRRGRHYNTLHACDQAVSDFDKAISLAPTSAPQGYNLVAELYSLESSVYSGCPDSTRRDPRKAIEAIQHAIALDSSRGGARGFVILAGAYASSGDLAEAVRLMRQALAVPGAAPSYREDWQRQLEEYQRTLAKQGAKGLERGSPPNQRLQSVGGDRCVVPDTNLRGCRKIVETDAAPNDASGHQRVSGRPCSCSLAPHMSVDARMAATLNHSGATP